MHKTDLIQTWTESVCGIMEFNGMGYERERRVWNSADDCCSNSSVEGSIWVAAVGMNDDWYGIIQQQQQHSSYSHFWDMFILHVRSFSIWHACQICLSRFDMCVVLLICFLLFCSFNVLDFIFILFFRHRRRLRHRIRLPLLAIPLSFYCQALLARNPTILCLPLNILSLSFGISLLTEYGINAQLSSRAREHVCIYLCLHMRACVCVWVLFCFRMQANVPMYNNLNPFVMPIYKWGPSVVFCACEKVCLERFENMINRWWFWSMEACTHYMDSAYTIERARERERLTGRDRKEKQKGGAGALWNASKSGIKYSDVKGDGRRWQRG